MSNKEELEQLILSLNEEERAVAITIFLKLFSERKDKPQLPAQSD